MTILFKSFGEWTRQANLNLYKWAGDCLSMQTRTIILIAIVAVALLGAIGTFTGMVVGPNAEYDRFALCLSESGAKMYGAFWCSACNAQKRQFGSSFEHITYVECSLADRSGQTSACKQAEITAYPTWILPDGERKIGVVEFSELAEATGCEL